MKKKTEKALGSCLMWMFVYIWWYPLRWMFYDFPKWLINKLAKKETGKVRYVRSKDSDTFHRPSCRAVRQIDKQNLVGYGCDYQDMIRNGLTPCKKCKPR